MIKVLIVDDEELARNRLKRHLSGAQYALSEARDGLEALKILKDDPPHLVFLDVEMPGLNGLEVLQNLEQRSFKIIFQTAYDEFALRAFEENACDYLLKPFSEARLQTALQRAISQTESDRQLRNLTSQLHQQGRYLEKLTVKQGANLRVIPLRDVVCFTSKDHYTFIHTTKAEYLTELSLSFLAAQLPPNQFLRIHRNGLVRVESVRGLRGGANMEVELSGGQRLPVARNARNRLRALLIGAPPKRLG